MISAVIVDDEFKSSEILETLLEKYAPDIKIIGRADNIKKAEELVRKMEPQLLFLDVEMPHGDGFDFLRKYSSLPFEVVFVTAYDHYALKAIKFSAIDYLLKPIDPDDLEKAVEKIRHRLDNKTSIEGQFRLLLDAVKTREPLKRIAIPGVNSIVMASISDILYCEADSNYTNIFLRDKSRMIVAKTLKEYEELLSEHNFFRVHNSVLINIDHIVQYIKGDGGYVVMSDGKSIEVSRRKKAEFLQRIGS